jgi:hypothetical protein
MLEVGKMNEHAWTKSFRLGLYMRGSFQKWLLAITIDMTHDENRNAINANLRGKSKQEM